MTFALSLDLLLGYAGIVTLGHSLFFGLGAYRQRHRLGAWMGRAGERAADRRRGVSAAVGTALGAIVLRTARFTLLMLTLSSVFLASEAANKAALAHGRSRRADRE